MSGVAKAFLVGRLGKDPEIKNLESGKMVANFSIATSKKYKDKEETTTWHRVVLWSPLAEIAEKYLKKGDQVCIDGEITNRSWMKDGETKHVTEIVGKDMLMLGGNG